MKTTHYGSLLLAAALSAAPCLQAAAAEAAVAAKAPAGSVERGEAKAAEAMLERAVGYLKKHGDKRAYAAFNNPKGGFVQGQYYVYAVGTDGTMYANGGAPGVLAGKNAFDLHDAAGKPLIRELLEAASKADSGQIEYRWLNRADNKVENKVAMFRKVGKQVVVVGYYTPRATVEQAQDLMEKAVAELKQNGSGAYAAFNDRKGKFVQGDLYVFAIGLDDGKYRAYGASPKRSGEDVSAMRDAAGKPLVEEMIALAKSKGSGQVEYVWRNPATNAVETKHSLIQRVDDVLIGVGYYSK
jgi:cytochrome c